LEFWYYYIGATVSLFLLHDFQSEIPLMAKQLGDMVTEGSLEKVSISDFFLLALGILVFRTLSRLLFFYPARIQQKNLRLELITRIEEANPQTYKDFNDGQLFQTIFNDLNRIRGFIGFALLQVGNIIIAATIFIPKINDFNPDLLVAFTPMLVCIVLFTTIIYFMQPVMVEGMELAGEVQNFLIESYDAKKTIKNFHAEKSFYKIFQKHSNSELWNFFKFTASKNISFPLIKIGVGASLIWGALIVKESGMPGSALIFFSGFLYLVLEPLMLISWIGVVTSQGFASWGRIKNLLNKLDVKPDSKATGTNTFEPTIKFWNNELKPILKENSWNVVVGDTGIGKSYILEHYSNFLKNKKLSFSFIQQEPFLYNDTINNNIFLGLAETKEKKKFVRMCIEMFALDQLDESVDKVLSMEVGENGKKLSGGQAKRVALIRSLVSDVEFILWDDPFSSVDLILEKQILEKMKTLDFLKKKTFICTSHRVSTVRSCDWLIFVDKENDIPYMGETKQIFSEDNKVSEYFRKQLV
jgi:ATP-binding cassette subfamily B protein